MGHGSGRGWGGAGGGGDGLTSGLAWVWADGLGGGGGDALVSGSGPAGSGVEELTTGHRSGRSAVKAEMESSHWSIRQILVYDWSVEVT